MKNLLPAIAALVLSCCTSQKNTSPVRSDTAVANSSTATDQNETRSATPTKSIILNNPATEPEAKVSKPNKQVGSGSNAEAVNPENENSGLPACLKKMIQQFKKEDVQNPPRKIYSYTYNRKTVYYVTPPCCDFFSDLYDKNCNIIAHPDGGFTGKGDGRSTDFIKTRTNGKLIWEDKRKSK